MKALILISFVLWLPTFFQSGWPTYIEESGLFAVLVPGNMKAKEKMIETATGDYLLQSVYHQSDLDSTENMLYLINYHKIQEDMYVEDSLEQNEELLIQMATDMSSSLQDAKLLYTNPTTGLDFSSVEYRITYGKENQNLKGKFILNRTHLYSIQVYTTKDKALNRNMDLFIDSFRILNN
jgi:hypothetical protein